MKIAVLGPKKEYWGATIVQIPFYLALKERFPNSTIALFSPVTTSKLLHDLNLVDEIHFYKDRQRLRCLQKVRQFSPQILFHQRPYSEFLNISLPFCRAHEIIGYDRSMVGRFFQTHSIELNTNIYMAFHYLNLLEPLAKSQHQPVKYFRDFFLGANTEHQPQNRLVIIPGAGGDEKRYSWNHYKKIVELVASKVPSVNIDFVIGTKESFMIKDINSFAPKIKTNYYLNRNIKELTHLMNTANIVITNDSGPGHIAQLLGVPTISLWGWKDDVVFPKFNEWFLTREKNYPIFANYDESIQTIKPELIASLALGHF
jgi:ADP-heptose:LPS heptosyltransferase